MTGYATSQSHASTLSAGTARYPAWLRTVLWVDGITGLGSALMLLAAPQLAADLMGVPAAVLQAGALLTLPFVALIALLLARPQLPRNGVRAIVALNALWVVASIEVLITLSAAMTSLGLAYGVAQTVFVAVLAGLQFRALSNS